MRHLPCISHRTSLRTSILALAAVALLSACGGGSNSASSDPVTPPVVIAPALTPAMINQIDGYVQAQLQRQHIPGMSVAVTRNGIAVWQKGYGMANLATGATVTPDTVFRIASVTKQFTASAIMLLVQDGKLSLDQPISQVFPTAPASWKAITIRHLLNHTSGLPRDFPDELLGKIDPTRLPSIDQLIALAGEMPLPYSTGSEQAYSNVGYHLLGFVIEKTTGQHYASFLRQRIFSPLGMNSADVISTTKPVPLMAGAYTWDGAAVRAASTFILTPGLVEAEGGLQMSAADLARWDAALNGEAYLTKASLAQMWEPTRLNDGSTVPYGFGWSLKTVNQRPFVSHNGLIAGFTSQYARYAGEGWSIIVLANSDSAAVGHVVSRIAAIVDPRLNWSIGTDPRPQTGALLRTVMDESARGMLQADARFAPQFQAMLTPRVLQEFTAYLKPWAPIEQFGYIDQVELHGMQVARYLVRSQYEQAVIGIALDAQGRITFIGLLDE